MPSGDMSASDPVDGWVKAAQGGDRQAMEQLIEHFQDRVWRRARYRIGDNDEAWEVSQDVFILCFRKINQYRGDAPFWAWLGRIVDNQVRNRQGWWRRRRRAQTFSLDELGSGDEDHAPVEFPDKAPSPRDQAAGHEAVDHLESAMEQLSPDHREILLLRFADNLSYEEIAESLNLTLGTVKSRINRARSELRVKMAPYLIK
jgi:RNA polymerase sigma-70 factor (ECF subfamily)